MMNQNTQNNPQPLTTDEQTSDHWKEAISKSKNIGSFAVDKFKQSILYTNKKIFWSLTTMLSLFVIIIVLGVLFGEKDSKTPKVVENIPTPTPFVAPHATIPPSAGILYTSQEKLLQLKNQINALDPKQSRLKPPTINYDIKF
jgi:hypothetical protein